MSVYRRKKKFKLSFYNVFPIVALIISTICLIYNIFVYYEIRLLYNNDFERFVISKPFPKGAQYKSN